MFVNVVGRGVEVDEAIGDQIGRRLGFALGRFADRIGRVAFHLTDINGPRGGIDKRCRVIVSVNGQAAVVVEDEDSDLETLIDRTADRVGHAVRRRFDRTRFYVTPRSVLAN